MCNLQSDDTVDTFKQPHIVYTAKIRDMTSLLIHSFYGDQSVS